MNIASIDIGTNTVLLLIASIDFKTNTVIELMEKHSYPRIGEDLFSKSIIQESKILLLLKILREFRAIAQSYNCSKIISTATFAFRKAKNSANILKRVKETTGLDIKILSGEEEAVLALLGVCGLDYKNESCQVIDIGGGSTEFIISNNGKLISNNSFNIGVVTLKEQQEVWEHNLSELQNFLYKEFHELKKLKSALKTFVIAGTPITLAKMLQINIPFEKQILNGYKLKLWQVEEMVKFLSSISSKQILEKYGQIVENREDLILFGTIILFNIMKILNLDNVIVCTKGLRHGVIFNELLENPKVLI